MLRKRLSFRKIKMQNIPFIEIIWPWTNEVMGDLKKKAGNLLFLLSKKALSELQVSLAERLSQLCTPCLISEMREQKWFELQELPFLKERPRQEYLRFIENCNADWLSYFFQKYEVLDTQIKTIKFLWCNQILEFLERLEKDLDCLSSIFNQNQRLGQVVSLIQNEGDCHNGGRSVSIVKFKRGLKLVYKPKSLEIAVWFNSILISLNRLGLNPPLKNYRILPRDNYGWEEFIEHAPCKNLEEVKRYYEQSGMLLGLVYLINGSDFHAENVIASGESPIFIDVETLFHHKNIDRNNQNSKQLMKDCVISTAFLPRYMWRREGKREEDVSGLAMDVDQASVLTLEKINTSRMRFVRKNKKIETKQLHRVFYCNQPIQPNDYVNEIVIGFGKLYDLVYNNRSYFKKQISSTKNWTVRYLLRNSLIYSYTLSHLLAPSLILNHKQREEKIQSVEKVVRRRKKFPQILSEERTSLLQGDIPLFYTTPSSRDLYCNQVCVATNYFDRSALKQVFSRLKKMDEHSKAFQQHLIRLSFHAKMQPLHEQGMVSIPISHELSSEKKILQYVKTLAESLEKTALEFDEGVWNWIHLQPNLNRDYYEPYFMEESVFSGRIGIGLFFSALSHFTNEKRWQHAAWKSISHLRSRLNHENPKKLLAEWGLSAMEGAGGIAYGLLHIGRLLSAPLLIEEAKKLFLSIGEDQIFKDKYYDIIYGNAGLILTLLSFYSFYPEKKILDLAVKCGEHLCSKVKKLKSGHFAWLDRSGKAHPGFSHGVAGISYSLFKLASVVTNNTFSDLAQKALSFERSLYSAEHQNWPRFLDSGNSVTYPASWCHGATGIGFSRLASLPFFADEKIRYEIEIAIETTKKKFLFSPHNLCCGSLGRLEFLQTAVPGFVDSQSVSAILQGIDAEQLCRTHPGFMKGAAGLGYTLLRYLDKSKLPQVLLFE